VRTNRQPGELGGHIASFASSATLYDVGFNHFFHAPTDSHGGDLLYIQGHSSTGVYARAFLEGRLSAEQLDNFRREVDGKGVSSYPHPWLMPDFWQLPTVSMGLGPLMAIYQARFLKYLHHRGLADTANRKVWCFMGDGESDEPESLGAISLAGREKLDNLVFVVNCNLQRLDGPVRGNGKIIQELEGVFRGAGWQVIKLLWGSYWDPLLAKDNKGLLRKRMEECVDGDYQRMKANDGAYVREHFFGKYPELREMVANMTDADIWKLNRGGHDPHKIYAAYHLATKTEGQPTVILAKTVKGYGMGQAGEGKNITHQQKKMDLASVKGFRDRFNVPVPDSALEEVPFFHPGDDSPEVRYLKERRAALGGSLPQRKPATEKLEVPTLAAFDAVTASTGEREISTTMAFVRALNVALKDKVIGPRIVPIVADEARTFGMEGLFRQIGIYSPHGQTYQPVDSDQLMFYKEDIKGQLLQEGITEAGAMSSWIAAATSYANSKLAMMPFFIYYSMFGFQRIGDLCWAAGDMRARGFLIGGTSGRTTLNGEGLQHEDGHSHLLAAAIPNCKAYDPTYSYELAVIIQDGLRRMLHEHEDVYYYLTVMNENYAHPALPAGAEDGILRGMYCLKEGNPKAKLKVNLLGSGAILRESIAAAELLEAEFKVSANIFSCTSFVELARDGQDAERSARFGEPREAYVTTLLKDRPGPVIAATDYVRAYSEQIRAFVPQRYVTLGTDGYGRSDTREKLRHFFEVDRYFIAHAAIKALVDDGQLKPADLKRAATVFKIPTDKANPVTV
jgi:pyruvate dehydrogenase E1 component